MVIRASTFIFMNDFLQKYKIDFAYSVQTKQNRYFTMQRNVSLKVIV